MISDDDTSPVKIADARFLAAEDHDFQRLTLVRMLASLGAQHIAEAADGRAALGVIQEITQPIDIIICDLDMPGMDGMEFIRHVGDMVSPYAFIPALEANGRIDELLKIPDCDVAQGYLFARPMAATQIADWATAWGPPE